MKKQTKVTMVGREVVADGKIMEGPNSFKYLRCFSGMEVGRRMWR